jgi:hypothetical protein
VAYDVRVIEGQDSEYCDECGFDGSLVQTEHIVGRYKALAEQWSCLIAKYPETLLRQRPTPGVWCGFEYANHFAIALHWLALVIDGTTAPVPAPPTDDPTRHPDNCLEWSPDMLMGCIRDGANAVLGSAYLDATETLRRAELISFGHFRLKVATALRHGLHDSEHHVLDVRRGMARINLTLGHSALREQDAT